MKLNHQVIHPYIPNSVLPIKDQMLDEIGVKSVEAFYASIPDKLRYNLPLNLPSPIHSEYLLRRHVEDILQCNQTCKENLNFLGAGCYQHYVPAVCDEVNQRAEFLTAYAGEPYDDHGRFQALFEYASMMGELLNMDVVNVPTYDGFQAAASSLRMAARITNRSKLLISASMSPDKGSKILDYCKPELTIQWIKFDPQSGQIDLDDLKQKLTIDTAAVLFENPSYLGVIEANGDVISQMAHEQGALSVVSVDPISLGILIPPADYGADIVCGDIQPLGMHLNFGGGQAGFIASHDEEKFVMAYPSRLFGIGRTRVEGEYGFGDVAYERTSFAVREAGNEWVGTAAALWGITAGVYLALMGPQGMQEIGDGILTRTQYAMTQLSRIPGVKAPYFTAPHFKEFVVDFTQTGKSISEINKSLITKGIFGGKDISWEFPEFGQCALYCFTELHTADDIDYLVSCLREVIQ